VDFGGAPPVSHAGTAYPIAALAKRVEGTVVATIKIDEDGAVNEAQIVSGPDELGAVLNSVTNWHFGKEAAGTTRQVRITFVLPKGDLPNLSDAEIARETRRAAARAMSERTGGLPLQGKPIKGILVSGLSEHAKEDLLARLPVHTGDILTVDLITDIDMALGQYDRRLGVATFADNNEPMIRIAPQDSPEFGRAVNGGPGLQPGTRAEVAGDFTGQRIRGSGNIQPALISRVEPVYPPLAKQAHVQGTVDLSAIIGKDGHVQDLKVVRGHPLLVQAALDAVNQWVYKPTLMNGEPVEIATDIQVNFALDSMGSQTSTPELLNRVEPHYPPLAKQANVQGTVALSATIGKDGKVQDVELVSGHPLLVQAAIDAVKQWVYEPTMINGEATEVNTEISLSFTLPPSGSGEIPPQIHAGSILSQGDRLIVYVKPVYPPEAKQTGILGTVEFSALIGKDGHVRDLKVVSGHPLLIRPALDAVKQWIYKPIMLNGEPVEVRTTILVPFTLQ
jgi:TonB family protein